MATKRQQTMAKLTRERNVKEKRERKLEKKRAKKLAAAEGGTLEGGEPLVETDETLVPTAD
ncbi:MAG: hypothetical protein ABWY51_06010 [Gaiellaceae bacterium]